MKELIPQKMKNIYHLFQAVLANIWYEFPSRKLKIIGVTGTNGKTTTCQMITRILEEAGHKVAMISTINFKLGKKEWVNKTKFTTLSSFATQKFIRKAVEENCDYLVLETSSHSLDQNRVWGIKYDVAVVTNVTREHFDYHRTIEKYRKAKMKLFRMVSKSKGILIANLNMENPEEFLKYKAKEKYGYAAKLPIPHFSFPIKSQLRLIIAKEIELGINFSKFKVHDLKFKINLPGDFNIENALAALSVGISQEISLEAIAKALEKIKGVPGRFEYIPNSRGFNIIIDYAVTPDSLEKFYALISKTKQLGARIIAVLGSCGERDRGKRPIMGKIVSRFADYAIVTNEDPYGENPQKIINEVFKGVISTDKSKITNPGIYEKHKQEGVSCWRIPSRREAIKKALRLAGPGDIVAITGKGAEVTMAVGKKRILWNDRRVIEEELEKI
ncbi:MAG: UDP-N-acetylmuramoyl-L-alanyl-D-glutamate--2,6-diaminopimelate ligase [Candidatus Moranbacteria bacterium]|nr:UDP-N-acetylmuramoyl-L-alanyl-D-glutamate--2,6-diaminopimelate ligase [Candidatus Moranbacteria bacterium]